MCDTPNFGDHGKIQVKLGHYINKIRYFSTNKRLHTPIQSQELRATPHNQHVLAVSLYAIHVAVVHREVSIETPMLYLTTYQIECSLLLYYR